ncbi:hypothetical protein FRC04_011568 [Tulasnella sp. 424]|nr:hypothetical protein FRC04_011568 [Tulasnella sp. 424]KAG8971568.1 hypothetical protein FRC05_010978 [Tulasnella sp. 425]
MSTEPRRKDRPHQSNLFMTETFIFGIFVTVVAFTVPIFLASTWDGKNEAVVRVAKSVVKTAEELLPEAETVRTVVMDNMEKPIPYLRRLPNIVPYIIVIPSIVASITVSVVSTLLSFFNTFLLSPLLTLFAPAVILGHVSFDIFIRTPYNAFSWILKLLYPVYVFCGIAVLVGVLFGLAGAGIGRVGLWLTGRTEEAEEGAEEQGSRFDRLGRPRAFEDRKGKGRELPVEDIGGTRKPRKVEFANQSPVRW